MSIVSRDHKIVASITIYCAYKQLTIGWILKFVDILSIWYPSVRICSNYLLL
ncbi:hypothetical protein ACS0TY_014563 [Phlomoides rotata]